MKTTEQTGTPNGRKMVGQMNCRCSNLCWKMQINNVKAKSIVCTFTTGIQCLLGRLNALQINGGAIYSNVNDPTFATMCSASVGAWN